MCVRARALIHTHTYVRLSEKNGKKARPVDHKQNEFDPNSRFMVAVNILVYNNIYIYIYREREREREGETLKGKLQSQLAENNIYEQVSN